MRQGGALQAKPQAEAERLSLQQCQLHAAAAEQLAGFVAYENNRRALLELARQWRMRAESLT